MTDHKPHISGDDVGALLADQHHHKQAREHEKQFGALANTTRHEAPFLKDRFVKSEKFHLRDIPIDSVHPLAPASGKSHSSGPIVVDANKGSFGRLHGHFGAPPRVVILDGKHRHAEALARGEKTIKAYVGEHAQEHIDQHSSTQHAEEPGHVSPERANQILAERGW